MTSTVEFVGQDLAEAIAAAAGALNLPPEKLKFNVIEMGTKGFLGLGRRRARIAVDPDDPSLYLDEPAPTEEAEAPAEPDPGRAVEAAEAAETEGPESPGPARAAAKPKAPKPRPPRAAPSALSQPLTPQDLPPPDPADGRRNPGGRSPGRDSRPGPDRGGRHTQPLGLGRRLEYGPPGFPAGG
jgi:hypothetical protein